MKLTQPVSLWSFQDEFELPKQACKTPAEPRMALIEGDVPVDATKHANHCKGVGKLIHLVMCSRPGVANAARELSQFASNPSNAHTKAMLRCMKCCIDTESQGLVLKPTG